jgi:DNA-binding MarR family transcriptional regulator
MNKTTTPITIQRQTQFDVDKTIGYQSAVLTTRLRKTMHDILVKNKLDINPDEMGILSNLMKHTSMTMTHLAESILKDNANVTRLVKGLEAKKLLKKSQDSTDKRISRISITAVGIEKVEKALDKMEYMTQRATYNISQKEHDEACEVLSRINNNLMEFIASDNG